MIISTCLEILSWWDFHLLLIFSQYDIAEQDDVFNQLQMAVDASELVSPLIPTTVKAIMDTWTKQSGFPVLTVSAPNSNTLRVTQVLPLLKAKAI